MSATAIAPIGARQINNDLYVGYSDLTTIQLAVTFAVAAGGKFCVVIPVGYAGSDTIASVHGGSVNVYLCDQRTAQVQNYTWNGTNYTPADVVFQGSIFASNLSITGDAVIDGQLSAQDGIFQTLSIGGVSIDPTTLAYTDVDNNFTTDQTINGNLSLSGNLSLNGGIAAEGGISADSASFNTCEVDGSPVRTFANSGGGGGGSIPTPGIAVSTGTAWGPSIDPTTVAYLNTANTFTQLQRGNAAFSGYGWTAVDLTASHTTLGTSNSGTTPLITFTNATAPANQRLWTIGAAAADLHFSMADDTGGDHYWLQVLRNVTAATQIGFFAPTWIGDRATSKGVMITPVPASAEVEMQTQTQGTAFDQMLYLNRQGGVVRVGSDGLQVDAGATVGNGALILENRQAYNRGQAPTIGGDGYNIVMNTNGGNILLNWDNPAKVIFGNGYEGNAGLVDNAGNAQFYGQFYALGDSTFGGALIVTTSLTVGSHTLKIGDESAITSGTRLTSDGTNLFLNGATGGSILLGWDTVESTIFGNGAQTQVASVTSKGDITGLSIHANGSSAVAAPAANSIWMDFSGTAGRLVVLGPSAGNRTNFQIIGLDGVGGSYGTYMQFDASFNANFYGTITATGAKNFRIPHPLIDGKDLLHSCLEGPEIAVFYRGEVTTRDGKAQVTLPDYFEALTFEEDRTVLLTQIFEDDDEPFAMLMASRVIDGSFSIRSSVPSVKVWWEVKAVRQLNVDRLQVTPPTVKEENADDKWQGRTDRAGVHENGKLHAQASGTPAADEGKSRRAQRVHPEDRGGAPRIQMG